jgi:DNA-binding NarL/FixJ family response regulator
MPNLTRILIADDHPLVRGALREAVASAIANFEIVESCNIEQLKKELENNAEVDLVLLDLAMPGACDFSGLVQLRAKHPCVPIVIVSGNEDLSVMRRCIDFGALGFIPKTTDFDTMRVAIGKVLEGAIWTPLDFDLATPADCATSELVRRLMSLTPQQMRVLTLLSDGLLNKQIANALSVSEATVKADVSAVLQKLDVDNRTQAVIIARKILSTSAPPEILEN